MPAGWSLFRWHLTSGASEPIGEVTAREAAGLRMSYLSVTPDGTRVLHSYSRMLVNLYVADGLR